MGHDPLREAVERAFRAGLSPSELAEIRVLRDLPVVRARHGGGRPSTVGGVIAGVLAEAVQSMKPPDGAPATDHNYLAAQALSAARHGSWTNRKSEASRYLRRRTPRSARSNRVAADDDPLTGTHRDAAVSKLLDTITDIVKRMDADPPPSGREPLPVLSVDETAYGCYGVAVWTPDHLLVPGHDRVVAAAAPDLCLLDRARHRAFASAYPDVKGTVRYLVGFTLDWDEGEPGGSDGDDHITLRLASGPYRDYLATVDYLAAEPTAYETLTRLLDDGEFAQVAAAAPPAAMWMSMTISTPDRRFLALKRSARVRLDKLRWTAGLSETMKGPVAGAADHEFDQDLFGLARRALLVEGGLGQEDYGDIVISWLGYYLPYGGIQVVAHVCTGLPEGTVKQRIRDAKEGGEHSESAFLSLDRETIEAIQTQSEGRQWIQPTPVILSELWRVAHLLSPEKGALFAPQ